MRKFLIYLFFSSSLFAQELIDTDGDGIPDFLDTDDDGDGVSTKKEITAANGTLIPFADIPSCDGNTTKPARIKKHLDKNCY